MAESKAESKAESESESKAESTQDVDGVKIGWSSNPEDTREGMRRATRQDSWVDALVTLLATVVFGLGWALVELERADPPVSLYDSAASENRAAAFASSIEHQAAGAFLNKRWGDEDPRWLEPTPQRSNR